MITKQEKKPATSDYKEFLLKRLQNPKMAAGYLTACLEESADVFLLGGRDVVEAHGGMSHLAKATKLNREGLYEMLSEKGNPRFSSLSTILDALGLKLELKAKAA
jgi:probable addiction module antidote protein